MKFDRYSYRSFGSAKIDRRRRGSLIAFLYLIGALLQPLSINGSIHSTATQQPQETEIAQAISDLESPNPFKSEAARQHILALGNEAVEPIISLLKRSLDEATDENDSATGASDRNPLRDSIKHLKEPNWNVINSCCDCLGRLKAVGAVRLLIKVIELRYDGIHVEIGTLKIAGYGTRTPEVVALESIGSPAEQSLLWELRTPKWALDSVDIGLPNDDPHTLLAKEHRVREIRTQVLEVLSVIGGNGTLTALESLLDTPEFASREEKYMLEFTIRRIRNKSHPIR